MRQVFFQKLTALLLTLTLALGLCACGGQGAQERGSQTAGSVSWADLSFDQPVELQYATQFTAAYSKEGYCRIDIQDGSSCLVVPEGASVPSDVPEEMTLVQQPLDNIYLAATSTMDFFRALDGIGNVTLSSLKADDWYIPEAKNAMENGTMTYAGKYRAPDYELILSKGCDLALENTMIYHTPEVKEELESFGIPVLVERSSYESHPLGRMEWVKFCGILLGKATEATACFQAQVDKLQQFADLPATGKTVAFFAITNSGGVTVRKPGDYVAKAIELAGGTYAFRDLKADENAQATTTLQMEAFYTGAKDADILIYNSTIEGELTTIDQLLDKSPLLADFQAVKAGNVWCTGKNLFQESLGLGDMMVDFHTIFTDPSVSDNALTYLHRLT